MYVFVWMLELENLICEELSRSDHFDSDSDLMWTCRQTRQQRMKRGMLGLNASTFPSHSAKRR